MLPGSMGRKLTASCDRKEVNTFFLFLKSFIWLFSCMSLRHKTWITSRKILTKGKWQLYTAATIVAGGLKWVNDTHLNWMLNQINNWQQTQQGKVKTETKSKLSETVTVRPLLDRWDLTPTDGWRRLRWRMEIQERDEQTESPGWCRWRSWPGDGVEQEQTDADPDHSQDCKFHLNLNVEYETPHIHHIYCDCSLYKTKGFIYLFIYLFIFYLSFNITHSKREWFVLRVSCSFWHLCVAVTCFIKH